MVSKVILELKIEKSVTSVRQMTGVTRVALDVDYNGNSTQELDLHVPKEQFLYSSHLLL